MPSPLDRKTNDLGLKFVPPASQTDPRVPLAEEFTLETSIGISLMRRSRQGGWAELPEFSVTAPRKLTITKGQLIAPIYPGVLNLNNVAIDIPALATPTNLVRQDDPVYLVAFSAEVGAAQDALLGQLSFQYKDQTSQQIVTIQKENARRVRAFWALVVCPGSLNATSFLTSLTQDANGDRRFQVTNKTDAGFPVSTMQFYCKDPELADGATYTVNSDSVEVFEVCRIRRVQNYTERGFTWGLNGEANLSVQFNVLRTAVATGAANNIDTQVRKRLLQVMSGIPDNGSAFTRAVQNLTSGAVAGNPGRAGESAGSPNNSVCLANDQRITFTNQQIVQKTAVQILVAGNDGNGNAQVSASLNTNSPNGTYFSDSRDDHKIYGPNGVEQSSLGNFINLGGTGALTWVADANATIKPGNTVYFVPGVRFPAGSGSTVAFDTIEQAWINAASISSANIRVGHLDDLNAYAEPANNESYIVVTGKERAALIHYIYKKVTVTADSDGTIVIPSGERGCFAFVQGVSGRIDAPARRGLTPAAQYNTLVYYPPRSLESWQFLTRYCEYQGTGALPNEAGLLDGATIISQPVFFIHTQGGGNSVFQGDANIRFTPIAMHLPTQVDSLGSFEFNAPVQLVGELYPGPVTFRELPLASGAGLALPAPGQVITTAASTAESNPRSMSIRIMANGQQMGFRTPVLASRKAFQAVLAFAVRKDHHLRMVVVTANGVGGENVAVDAASNVGIDMFRI